MLVKNTIIALMVVAPVLSIPLPPATKGTGTAATTKATPATKSTLAKPAAGKVSKSSVLASERTVDQDQASMKKLRKELQTAEGKLSKDKTTAKGLEKQELAQEKAAKLKAKTATKKASGKSKTPTTKLSTKVAKTPTKHTAKLRDEKPLNSLHHPTHSRHLKTNALTTEGGHRSQRNKHGLQIDTTGHHNRHSGHRAATPGTGRSSKYGVTTPGTGRSSRYSATTPGTGRSGRYSATTPRTGRSAKHSATTPGTGRSRKLTTPGSVTPGFPQTPFSGLSTGYSGRFSSPGFSPPPNGMSEEISWTPTSGGGYKESISWGQPSSAGLRRRALPATPISASTVLSPSESAIRKKHSRKSKKVHKHTIAETMQLGNMLIEAERVVNGLEEQMNKPATEFSNLQRHSKSKRPTTHAVHKTPTTPPATPPAAKTA